MTECPSGVCFVPGRPDQLRETYGYLPDAFRAAVATDALRLKTRARVFRPQRPQVRWCPKGGASFMELGWVSVFPHLHWYS
jgi:hypothetical protein